MLQEELVKCDDELEIAKKENIDFKNKLNDASAAVEEEGLMNAI